MLFNPLASGNPTSRTRMLTHYSRGTFQLEVVSKVWLVVDGIYIWEFFTNLDYEWSVIRGHRPYRWTIWIYSIARISTLAAISLNLLVFSVTTPILNCQAWAVFIWSFSFLSLCLSSLLIALRIFAIWHNNKVVKGIAAGLWVTSASILILGVARIRAIWYPLEETCAVINLGSSKPSFIALFIADFLMLVIMLVGLLRLRRRGGDTFELGRLLWRQGIIWLAISVVAEVLQTVFMMLNVNELLNSVFLVPAVVTLVIASTRLYRSLANFSSPVESGQIGLEESLRTNRSISKRGPFVHVSSNRLEVTVHKDFEEHPMPEANQFASYQSSHSQLNDKPHEISFDDNTSNAIEDRVKK